MKKWQYEIIVQMNDGTEYVVWSYSKHHSVDEGLKTRKQKRRARRLEKKYGYSSDQMLSGMAHCQTAIGWIKGIRASLLKENEKGNYDVDIVKDGLFNPHYRRGDREDLWVSPKDVRDVYFKMHLLDKGVQPYEG